ncbi:MAG: hypothetical protein JOZ51_22550 [Chloroflexi bacterium]|nr:hypothetical protein [Chloroflexota bacterium]
MMRAYEEIIDLIAASAGSDRSRLVYPSEATKRRIVDLLQRQTSGGISPEEAAELGQYAQFEHLMCLARVLAPYQLGEKQAVI